MKNLNTFIESLIYKGDKISAENYRKGRFFVTSMLLFFVINLIFVSYLFFQIPDYGRFQFAFFNTVFFIVQLSVIFYYKYFGRRITMVNVFAFLIFLSVYPTYAKSGGIYSLDLTWYCIVIPCWIFLVSNRKSGIFWFGAGIVFAAILLYADVNGFRDFRQDTMHIQGATYFVNMFLAGIMTIIVMSIHEKNKEKYMLEVISAKEEIESKNKELEIQKQDIVSSITYAKRIQQAVLPNEDSIYRSIPLSFILFKPRDIVSGDFFWFHEVDRDTSILVVADCTGHGVPGAFMTVIGSSLLNQIVIENKMTNPAEILMELDKRITSTLKQEKQHFQIVQDGMDLSLLKINKQTKEFIYTSAKRPAIFIREKQIQEMKGSKFSLGGLRSGEKTFEEIKMNFLEDDIIYLFTDGYIDQFGGQENKKFMIKRLRELLLTSHHLPMNEQKQIAETTITQWIGNNEQTDDILLMGIRF